MKTLPERIAFYTRKVADRTAHHPARQLPAKFIFRSDRLNAYKKRLNELIYENKMEAKR